MRAPKPKADAIIMKISIGKYSDGIYVPGISGYVILKSIVTCQAKNLIIFYQMIKQENYHIDKEGACTKF